MAKPIDAMQPIRKIIGQLICAILSRHVMRLRAETPSCGPSPIKIAPSRHFPPSAFVVRIAARRIAALGLDQHVAADRSGVTRAAAAMLDHDRAGITRFMHRCESYK